MKDMLLASASNGGAMGTVMMVVWCVVIFGFMYFAMIRPQKKQEKRQDEIRESVAVGDSILTTSGFYGMVIDVQDDMVIVEFGNNKNCRIPMQKTAIVDVEKADAE